MTPEEMIRNKKARQSGVIPYGTPMPASSTSVASTEPVPTPSSSMAPESEVQKATAPVAPPQKRAPVATQASVQRLTAPAPAPEPMPRYTPPEQAPVPYGAPESQSNAESWFSRESQPTLPVPDQPERDPHRSLLQALMGWDDVPKGQKWNHYLQHGFVGVSPQNVQSVTEMARLENQNARATSPTFGQELRAKEQKRRTLMDQWNKLLTDWNQGRYAGDEQNVQEFYRIAEGLRNELTAEGINPNTLRPPSLNAGGFAQGFQRSLQDDRAKLDWIGGWLDQIQKNVARDPNWLDSTAAQMYFDKLSEYTILNWAQSKGAIADAEKVRAQVEAMPTADREVFDRFMSQFFSANQVSQLEAMANRGSREAKSIIEDFTQFMNLSDDGPGSYGTVDKNGNVTLSPRADHLMNSALLAWKTLYNNRENNPIDVNAAITSYRNARDAFLQYTMQNANVDRKMVWNSALDQYNIYKDMYNRKLPMLGLAWGWGHRGPQVDQNFGEYLAQWQSRQGPSSSVMANAGLGVGHVPQLTDDPRGGKGGRGGLAIPEDARYSEQYGKYVWKDKKTGKWRYQ